MAALNYTAIDMSDYLNNAIMLDDDSHVNPISPYVFLVSVKRTITNRVLLDKILLVIAIFYECIISVTWVKISYYECTIIMVSDVAISCLCRFRGEPYSGVIKTSESAFAFNFYCARASKRTEWMTISTLST